MTSNVQAVSMKVVFASTSPDEMENNLQLVSATCAQGHMRTRRFKAQSCQPVGSHPHRRGMSSDASSRQRTLRSDVWHSSTWTEIFYLGCLQCTVANGGFGRESDRVQAGTQSLQGEGGGNESSVAVFVQTRPHSTIGNQMKYYGRSRSRAARSCVDVTPVFGLWLLCPWDRCPCVAGSDFRSAASQALGPSDPNARSCGSPVSLGTPYDDSAIAGHQIALAPLLVSPPRTTHYSCFSASELTVCTSS
jgi:hypothetical protein